MTEKNEELLKEAERATKLWVENGTLAKNIPVHGIYGVHIKKKNTEKAQKPPKQRRGQGYISYLTEERIKKMEEWADRQKIARQYLV